MNYKLKCDKCGHEYWRKGTSVEPDTDAYEINDARGHDCPTCGSESFEVIDEEADES